MTNETEILDAEVIDQPIQRRESAMVATSDPYMGMAQMAMSQGKIAEMKELLAMKREWDAEEARKLFIAAMAKFKAKGLVVGKDKENKQYGSMYTTLGNLVNTASGIMAEFGLSVDWEPDHSKQGQIGITCTLSHEAGHKKSVTLHAEPDKSGAKNPIQQMKSSATYLRGLTFEMVTGIATSESAGINMDDDGDAAGAVNSHENMAKVADYEAAILDAVDDVALNKVGAQISDCGLPPQLRTRLRKAYSARLKDLRSATP